MQNEFDNNKLFIADMLEAVLHIQDFTKDVSFESFTHSVLIQSAVIRQFEIIGEASSRISEAFKIKHFNINWRSVKEFRNLLIHEYHRIDLAIIWTTIFSNLPELKEQLEIILVSLKNEKS